MAYVDYIYLSLEIQLFHYLYLSQRSHSAFSLLDDNVMMQCSGVSQDSQHGLKKEGGAAGLANWKSVDRLDNSSKTLLANATLLVIIHTHHYNGLSTHLA